MKIPRLIFPVAAVTLGLVMMAPALPAHAAPPHMRRVMIWSGNVDDVTVVSIRADRVWMNTLRGKSADDVNAVVTRRLPERPERVFLRHVLGRGDIYILQQPSPRNDFTARIRIHDPQPGRDYYEFTLERIPLSDGRVGRQYYQGYGERRYYQGYGQRRFYQSGPSLYLGWGDDGFFGGDDEGFFGGGDDEGDDD